MVEHNDYTSMSLSRKTYATTSDTEASAPSNSSFLHMLWSDVRALLLPLTLWICCNGLYGLLAYAIVAHYEHKGNSFARALGMQCHLSLALVNVTESDVVDDDV
jgi:hypothetical protein